MVMSGSVENQIWMGHGTDLGIQDDIDHTAASIDADPALAGELAVSAIRWLCAGHGVEIDGDDVYAAHDLARAAALRTDSEARLRATIAALCDRPHPAAQWVHGLLAAELAS